MICLEPIPAAGLVMTEVVPDDPGLCGFSLFLQTVMTDAGASHGWSFTRGVEVVFGY